MRIDELFYELPDELIAQTPVEPRDASRLLIVNRTDSSLVDARFADLPMLLRSDDLVVLNSTRVRAARLPLTRTTGGAAEVLLLSQLPSTQSTPVNELSSNKPAAVPARQNLERARHVNAHTARGAQLEPPLR